MIEPSGELPAIVLCLRRYLITFGTFGGRLHSDIALLDVEQVQRISLTKTQ